MNDFDTILQKTTTKNILLVFFAQLLVGEHLLTNITNINNYLAFLITEPLLLLILLINIILASNKKIYEKLNEQEKKGLTSFMKEITIIGFSIFGVLIVYPYIQKITIIVLLIITVLFLWKVAYNKTLKNINY